MKQVFKCENCNNEYTEMETTLNIYRCDKCNKEICIHCSIDNLNTGEVFCENCVGEPLDKVIYDILKTLFKLTENDNKVQDKLHLLEEKLKLLLR